RLPNSLPIPYFDSVQQVRAARQRQHAHGVLAQSAKGLSLTGGHINPFSRYGDAQTRETLIGFVKAIPGGASNRGDFLSDRFLASPATCFPSHARGCAGGRSKLCKTTEKVTSSVLAVLVKTRSGDRKST